MENHMNELQIFNNEEFGKIRMVMQNNEPIFCLGDLCKALELTAKEVNRRLSDEVVSKHPIADSLGRMQETLFVNEDGLYDVILESRKENAKKFRKWVTSEVLPSIRKNGGYIAGQETLSDDELMAKALLVAQNKLKEREEKIKELETSVQQMDKVICDMTPKVDYADRILSSTDCMTVSQIAQDYGLSAKTFNKALKTAGIQHKVGEQWILYAEHQGKGYVKTRLHDYTKTNGEVGTKPLTVWTQKGRMFLYERLKEIGVFPEMEKAV